MAYYLFHDGLHLICLYGIDNEILPLEVILCRRLFETAARLFDAVVQNVWKSQKDRWRDISQRQFVHHITQVNLRVVLTWCDINIAAVVDAKVGGAPTIDVVELPRVFNSPFFHSSPSSSFAFFTDIFIFS